MFSFDAGYQYGGGIASIGTYTPASAVTNGDYSNAPWFRFSRNPTAPPAWCGSYLMVKSRTQVVGINFDTNDWFAFDVKSGADDYGEYLASTGSRDAWSRTRTSRQAPRRRGQEILPRKGMDTSLNAFSVQTICVSRHKDITPIKNRKPRRTGLPHAST